MDNPALTLGLAMGLGMLSQVIARKIYLPGIVVLLAGGVIFGPDGLNWIRPASMGSALQIIVGFAVAVILFEGGMNLRISRIKREQAAIRGLITIGALITLIGGTLSTLLFLGWDFRTSILFGTLIIVTGPTVISPLLKRVRIHHGVSTVLDQGDAEFLADLDHGVHVSNVAAHVRQHQELGVALTGLAS